jgi:hypothetical protein
MKLPSSWNQITISQWSDIQSILNRDINVIHKNNRILAVLSQVPLQEIESLTFKQSAELSDKLTWLNNIPNQLIKEFSINGTTYEVVTDLVNISTAQYADLSEFLKKDGFYKYAECAAVMCLPKGHKYNSDDVYNRALLFWENMTMDVLYPMCDFFLRLLKASLPHLKNSLNNLNKELEMMSQEILTDLG